MKAGMYEIVKVRGRVGPEGQKRTKKDKKGQQIEKVALLPGRDRVDVMSMGYISNCNIAHLF
jgi:hypothetical protein